MKEGDAVWFITVRSEDLNDQDLLIAAVIIRKKRYRVYLRNNRLRILDEDNKEITDTGLTWDICKNVFTSLM